MVGIVGDGIECDGSGCVAAAKDENVGEVCGVGEGVAVADNVVWRVDGCPKRWSVGGDVGPCTSGAWSGKVEGSEVRTCGCR